MITIKKSYSTVTVANVWALFVESGTHFSWANYEDPRKPIEAFTASLKLLYTAEGMIFISFKRHADRSKEVIIEDMMGHLSDLDDDAFDKVLVYAARHLEDDGTEFAPERAELEKIITFEQFESEIRNKNGIREKLKEKPHGVTWTD